MLLSRRQLLVWHSLPPVVSIVPEPSLFLAAQWTLYSHSVQATVPVYITQCTTVTVDIVHCPIALTLFLCLLYKAKHTAAAIWDCPAMMCAQHCIINTLMWLCTVLYYLLEKHCVVI